MTDEKLNILSKHLDVILVELISKNKSIDLLTLSSLILARLAIIHDAVGTTDLFAKLLKLIVEERVLETITDNSSTKKSIH